MGVSKFFLFLFFFLCYFLTEIEANYKMENFTTIEMIFLREKIFWVKKNFEKKKFSRQFYYHNFFSKQVFKTIKQTFSIGS